MADSAFWLAEPDYPYWGTLPLYLKQKYLTRNRVYNGTYVYYYARYGGDIANLNDSGTCSVDDYNDLVDQFHAAGGTELEHIDPGWQLVRPEDTGSSDFYYLTEAEILAIQPVSSMIYARCRQMYCALIVWQQYLTTAAICLHDVSKFHARGRKKKG